MNLLATLLAVNQEGIETGCVGLMAAFPSVYGLTADSNSGKPGAPSLRFLQGWGLWSSALSSRESYQMVLICLQFRIVLSFVMRAIPSDMAVAPINRSLGSLG